MRAIVSRLGVVVGLLVAGCGGSGPAGSCQIAAQGSAGASCIDFAKGYSSDQAKQLCAMASSSTYSTGECATANRVGHCTQSSPDGEFSQVLSYYAPTTVADAMTSCSGQSGTFTAN